MSIRTPSVICGLLATFVTSASVAAPRGGAKAPAGGAVRGIKVLPDKAPDCSSLKSIAASVTRGCKTNDARAIAIYNFMLLSHYHRAYPSEPGGVPALKVINTYGWSLCGGLHSVQSALWRELGWDWRFVGWRGHTTVEAKYDNRWHYLDVFLKFYAWMPDPNAPDGRTIAGEDDLTRNLQGLITDAYVLNPSRRVVYAKNNQFELIGEKANWIAPAFLNCGDTLGGVISGLKTHRPGGPSEAWMGIKHATGGYRAEVDLAPGASLTNTWKGVDGAWHWGRSKQAPRHTCNNKDLRNCPAAGLVLEPYYQRPRSYANGSLIFAPDFSNAAWLKGLAASENVAFRNGRLVPARPGAPASITVALSSPYIMTRARCSVAGADALDISVDGGKTFRPADLADFTAAVKGHVAALARVRFATALKSLRFTVLVQNNPGALPYLSPGRNVVTVSTADPASLGQNKLVVTYAYAPGCRTKSPEQLCLEGKELAKQHNATWGETSTVVQKTFAAADLPATFTIDVPTPKGRYPVYPRMHYVRREVLTPGAKPLGMRPNVSPPVPRAGDELKTLPNPFLIGTQVPPKRIVRPTLTTRLPLVGGHFVTRSGKVPTSDFIKWPKTANEKVPAVAYLIGGKLKALPALKDIAAARLVFSAVRAHQNAPTKVGAVALRAPFQAARPYDFARLGDLLGTAVVPKLPANAPDWAPPRQFKIDVTSLVRRISAGEATFHGLALRVVPDRGVDDGWTVRIHIPKRPRIALEIDTYVPPATAPRRPDR
ncbi:MAG: transglutaminase domain-containing protein [Phycisphaerae bacterium]|nr:transglutaminase domain-containing protein [Phycisphaerae bacterium]